MRRGCRLPSARSRGEGQVSSGCCAPGGETPGERNWDGHTLQASSAKHWCQHQPGGDGAFTPTAGTPRAPSWLRLFFSTSTWGHRGAAGLPGTACNRPPSAGVRGMWSAGGRGWWGQAGVQAEPSFCLTPEAIAQGPAEIRSGPLPVAALRIGGAVGCGGPHTHQRLPQQPGRSPSPLTFSVFTDSVSLGGTLAVGRRNALGGTLHAWEWARCSPQPPADPLRIWEGPRGREARRPPYRHPPVPWRAAESPLGKTLCPATHLPRKEAKGPNRILSLCLAPAYSPDCLVCTERSPKHLRYGCTFACPSRYTLETWE